MFEKAKPVLKWLDRTVGIVLTLLSNYVTAPLVAFFINKEGKLMRPFTIWAKPDTTFETYHVMIPKYFNSIPKDQSLEEKIKSKAVDLLTYVAIVGIEVMYLFTTYVKNVITIVTNPFPNLDWNAMYTSNIHNKVPVVISGTEKVNYGFNGKGGFTYYRAADLFNLIGVLPICSELCLYINIGYDLQLTCEEDGSITSEGEQPFIFRVGFRHFNQASA